MGSCFTENIGTRLVDYKFQADVNPFGILYNPDSVAKGLKFLLHEKKFSTTDLIQHDGLWHSFYHHGKFSFSSQIETLEAINSRIKTSAGFLKNANFLFVTFGTAWIYKYKKTGLTVSNCHKIPAIEFERTRLSVAEIVEEYVNIINEIKNINPDLKFIFTVSPIRHWKDGAVENQRSKATLVLAIDEIMKKAGTDNCGYFPAYEIMMDELRDYRFYASDMIHISDVAVNHIWTIFVDSIIDSESRKIATEIQKIIKAKNHKPSGKNLLEHFRFLKAMLAQTISIEEKSGHLNLKTEKEFFAKKINELKVLLGRY